VTALCWFTYSLLRVRRTNHVYNNANLSDSGQYLSIYFDNNNDRNLLARQPLLSGTVSVYDCLCFCRLLSAVCLSMTAVVFCRCRGFALQLASHFAYLL